MVASFLIQLLHSDIFSSLNLKFFKKCNPRTVIHMYLPRPRPIDLVQFTNSNEFSIRKCAQFRCIQTKKMRILNFFVWLLLLPIVTFKIERFILI